MLYLIQDLIHLDIPSGAVMPVLLVLFASYFLVKKVQCVNIMVDPSCKQARNWTCIKT